MKKTTIFPKINFCFAIVLTALLLALVACNDSGTNSNSTEGGQGSKTSEKNCTDVPEDKYCDPRDGQVYSTAEFDSMVWMTQNMNYYMTGAHCYDDDDSNCDKYGKLYPNSLTFNICRNGWHVPSKDEFQKLLKFLKTSSDYNKMFGAKPAGFRSENGGFESVGDSAFFWTSTEMTGEGNCYVVFSSKGTAGTLTCKGKERGDGLSLRCVKD